MSHYFLSLITIILLFFLYQGQYQSDDKLSLVQVKIKNLKSHGRGSREETTKVSIGRNSVDERRISEDHLRKSRFGDRPNNSDPTTF